MTPIEKAKRALERHSNLFGGDTAPKQHETYQTAPKEAKTTQDRAKSTLNSYKRVYDSGYQGTERGTAAPRIGMTGPTGKRGNSVLSGWEDPKDSIGIDGDHYYNDATDTMFGPKDGTWPRGVSLVGAQGAQGPIGRAGIDGDAGEGSIGPQGPSGPQGDTGPQGPQGDSR